MKAAIPSTMRQWWVVPGPDGGELEWREISVPSPAPGDVLIEVRAAGVNRGELISRPLLNNRNPHARPTRSGIEFAGRIAAVGDDVSEWSIGDRVMGRGTGCHAEYTLADAAACMAVPSGLSDAEAGAIPNVFVTAHDALVTAAAMQPGDTVLITAGSSGVGSAAIQIARHLDAGAVVATTRNASKANELRSLGATEVIDTTSPGWAAEYLASGDPIDVVIDQVGGDLFPDLLRTMAVLGRYVSVGRNAGAAAAIDLDLLARNRLTLIGVTFRTRSAEEALACSSRFADHLLGAFSGGDLAPVLDRTFPLAELPAAHSYMLSNAQIGKVVLCP